MLYFKAMCYKKLGKYVKAERDYRVLVQMFKQNEGENMMDHVMQVILLSLTKDRVVHYDMILKSIQLCHVFSYSLPQPTIKCLSSYFIQDTRTLDMQKSSNVIHLILKDKPFFNRFSKETLVEALKSSTVEYYKQDAIIFLKGKVGVISHGSIRVRSH